MTRDEQVRALVRWQAEISPIGAMAPLIVGNFPAFMAKCAEIGLCRLSSAWARDDEQTYVVTEPEPPHEHDWHLTAPWLAEPEWYCSRCGERRPIQVPED